MDVGARSPAARILVVDLCSLVIGSLLISVWAHQLERMGWSMAVLILTRTIVAAIVVRRAGASVEREMVFFAACTIIGALNDWNTVVRHGIYMYTVPAAWPDITTIPVWMLAYWGVILRAMAGLFIVVAGRPADTVRFGRWRSDHAMARVAGHLVMVGLARVGITLWWGHPVWSWAVPLLALVVDLVLFPPTRRHALALTLLLAIAPAIESLYILVGGLHQYALGWLGGVPLWIVVWWALGGSVWGELVARVEYRVTHPPHTVRARPHRVSTTPITNATKASTVSAAPH